jgi:hypothetical protein
MGAAPIALPDLPLPISAQDRLLLPYWLLFSYFAIGALNENPRRGADLRTYPFMVLGAVVVALLIGLRFEVGADWDTYRFMFEYSRYADFGRMLEIGDPAYQSLNWAVDRLDGELWVVNLVCGAIFAWGLNRFAQVQPSPWLALLVAIPYMVVVVAMGYSRQAVALGILMAGMSSILRGGSVLRFALYVGAAALFHKTAVVAFPLVALASRHNRVLNLLLGAATSLLFYDLFLGDSMEDFVENYIEAEYSSQGAAIRVVMSIIPASVFFIFQNRLKFAPDEKLIWRNFSLAAFGLLALLIVLPSSTVVDRLALYIIPLQLAVLSRVSSTIFSPIIGKTVIIVYSFAVQFVWLNYAAHAEYWLPYRLYPL